MNNDSMRIYRYTIQAGDNFWQLAQRFNVSVQDIYAINPGVNPYQLYIGQSITLPVTSSNNRTIRSSVCISPGEVQLKSEMRRLWEEHVAWSRMAKISLTYNLPDKNAVVTRLLKNATDMGNSLRPFYGDQIADRYAELQTEHLFHAVNLFKAEAAGDKQAAKTTKTSLYHNADEIAFFWSNINPYLSNEEVKTMFYNHLDLSVNSKNEQNSVEIYDQIQDQALEMADLFTAAIVKQFPSIFRCK